MTGDESDVTASVSSGSLAESPETVVSQPLLGSGGARAPGGGGGGWGGGGRHDPNNGCEGDYRERHSLILTYTVK